MKRKMKEIGLIICLMAMLTGCWDRQEFTAISFATAMAIDYGEQGYDVTVKVVMPKNFATDKAATPDWIMQGRGNTLQSALQDLDMRTPRKIYWGHVKTLILGNGVLKQGCLKILEDLSGVNDFGLHTAVVGTKERGDEILKTVTDLSQVDNFYLYNLIKGTDEAYKGSMVMVKDLLVKSHYAGKCVYLPCVMLEKETFSATDKKNGNESDKKMLVLSAGVVLKDGKIAWQADENFDKGYRWVKSEIKNDILVLNLGEEKIAFQIVDTQNKMLWNIKEGKICLQIKGRANLAEDSEDILREEEMEKLENRINREIEKIVTESVIQAKLHNSDVFEVLQWQKIFMNGNGMNAEMEFQDVPIMIDANIQLKPRRLAD